MEDLLIQVFEVIDKNLVKKMAKVECLIIKNKREFDSLKKKQETIQAEITSMFSMNDHDIPISEQVAMVFRMAESDLKRQSTCGVDFGRVLDKADQSTWVKKPFLILKNLIWTGEWVSGRRVPLPRQFRTNSKKMSNENGKFANLGRISQKSKQIIVQVLEPRQNLLKEENALPKESQPDSFLSSFEVEDSQPYCSSTYLALAVANLIAKPAKSNR